MMTIVGSIGKIATPDPAEIERHNQNLNIEFLDRHERERGSSYEAQIHCGCQEETGASLKVQFRLPNAIRRQRMQPSSTTSREVTTMAQTIHREPAFLRRKQVEKRTGLSRSTIYQYVKDGVFPKPVPLGPRAVGWLESDVSGWIATRVKIARDTDRQSA